jgi:hypothetical protein
MGSLLLDGKTVFLVDASDESGKSVYGSSKTDFIMEGTTHNIDVGNLRSGEFPAPPL